MADANYLTRLGYYAVSPQSAPSVSMSTAFGYCHLGSFWLFFSSFPCLVYQIVSSCGAKQAFCMERLR